MTRDGSGAAHGPRRAGHEVRQALSRSKGGFAGIGLFSCVINLLMLTGPLFMLQVYDRVLTSRSIPTLVALTVLVAALYGFLGILELIRSRILMRIGHKLDADLNPRVFSIWITQGIVRSLGARTQPINDLQALRQFLSGPGPATLFDTPWVPVYLAIIFLMHPILGLVALGGAVIVFILALINEFRSRAPMEDANRANVAAANFATLGHRNAEAVTAMGMERHVRGKWLEFHDAASAAQRLAGDRSGAMTATSKTFRLFLQSVILAAGAALAVQQVVTPGVMIAASIIMGRALAPIDQAIGQWRGFVAARQAYGRLNLLLGGVPQQSERMALPEASGRLDVQGVSATPPGGERSVVEGLQFSLAPGQALGVIGPSASGKTTLARLLTGVWIPTRGTVRLDGATLDQWDREALGRQIGYLPQDVELFDGTVKENIARFDLEATDEDVILAAQRAGVHDLILKLADGYETVVGDAGAVLSGGQRQRVALARALYGDPALVVLDEPNASLDADGDAALTETIMGLRQRGKTTIVMAHRPSAISAVDTLLVLSDGRQVSFGPKDAVLREVTQVAPPAAVAG